MPIEAVLVYGEALECQLLTSTSLHSFARNVEGIESSAAIGIGGRTSKGRTGSQPVWGWEGKVGRREGSKVEGRTRLETIEGDRKSIEFD